jgi:hypothetical protein
MVKREFDDFVSEEHLDTNSDPDALEKFAERIMAEAKRLRGKSTKDRIQESIDDLENRYASVPWPGEEGDAWEQEMKEAAEEELMGVNYQCVMKAIIATKESCRWELGVLLTEMLTDAIFEAEKQADSIEDWSGQTVDEIEEFWKTLIQTQKDSREPASIPADVHDKVQSEAFKKCLGNYSTSPGGLAFIWVELLKLSALPEETPAKGEELETTREKSHQKEVKREVIIIEL